MQQLCVDAVNVARGMGYAVNVARGMGYSVNVACEGSYVRDIRCVCKPVCKGRVLGNEQPMVNVAHRPCVYGLKPYAFIRVVGNYE